MGRKLSKEEWLRRKRNKTIIMTVAALILLIFIIVFTIHFIGKLLRDNVKDENSTETIIDLPSTMLIKKDYLTPNMYSRPQTKLDQVKGIVIHYTANPGTTAEANRNYFQSLASKKTTSASSHYIIGLEGEILQCIPLTEIAYASNDRNIDTISIECCHPDETGEFNDETYESLISLVAELCTEFELEEEDIIRHYDVNEKPCPLYYVDNEDAWMKLKADVTEEVKQIEVVSKTK